MKPSKFGSYVLLSLLGCTTQLQAISLAEGKSDEPTKVTSQSSKDEAFCRLLGRPYSYRFGLALIGSDELNERDLGPLSLETLSPEAQEDVKDLATAAGGKLILDYSKMGLNYQLNLPTGTNALLLRVRDKFQYFNEEQSDAASFTYLEERGENSAWALQGAIMADFYFDSLYNNGLSLISKRGMKMFFRLGAELDINNLDTGKETDIQRYYALATLIANPDQDAKLFWIPGAFVTSPQFLQFGLVHEVNQLTSQEDTTWILGWQPRFVMDEGLTDSKFLQAFALNGRMYYQTFKSLKKNGKLFPTLFKVVDPRSNTSKQADPALAGLEEKSDIYSFINPILNFRGAKDTFGKAAELLEKYEKFKDETLEYEVKTGFGVDLGKGGNIELSYSFNGRHPIADLDKSFHWHELKLSTSFFYPSCREDQEKPPGGLFNAYISWQKGEIEPNYEEVDRIMAGVGLRF